MKRILILCAVGVILLITSSAEATGPFPPPQKWEPRLGVLYLFQKKAAEDGPWPVVPGGASGVLRYNLWGKVFSFDFHGWKLAPKKKYTLIYYPDPWPGEGLICLGSGKTNPAGNINLFNHHFDIGTSLPAKDDANWSPQYPSGAVGAKIWLVLSEDVDCAKSYMTGWNPDSYLFEYNLINFEWLGDN